MKDVQIPWGNHRAIPAPDGVTSLQAYWVHPPVCRHLQTIRREAVRAFFAYCGVLSGQLGVLIQRPTTLPRLPPGRVGLKSKVEEEVTGGVQRDRDAARAT